MKTTLLICLALIASWVQAQPLPAFPGAEGYGMYAKGGRGGRVIVCTTAQQIKKALQDSIGARNIWIPLGGTYDFGNQGGKVTILHRYVTIAGQTTAGYGPTFKNCTIAISCPEVIIRGIRIAPGDSVINQIKPETKDCLTIGADSVYNVIVDHCSARWALDENISVGNKGGRVTVSWCYIGQGFSLNTHPELEHSKNLMWHNTANDSVSYSHNYLFSTYDRNAQMVGPGRGEFVDNVIYNFHNGTNFGQDTVGKSGPDHNFDYTKLDFRRNYFRPGPDTPFGGDSASCLDSTNNVGKSKVFAEGNYGFRRVPDVGDDWGISAAQRKFQSLEPLQRSLVTAQDVDSSFMNVLNHAGCRPLDAVDSLARLDFINETGAILNGISVQTLLYPFGTIEAYSTAGGTDTVKIIVNGDVPFNRYVGLKFNQLNGAHQSKTILSSSCGSQSPALCNHGSGIITLLFSPGFITPLIGHTTTYNIEQPIVPPVAGGWPFVPSGVALADADNDALPDVAEVWLGGTTTSIVQNADQDGDGYTNLEEWQDLCMQLRIAGLPLEPRFFLHK